MSDNSYDKMETDDTCTELIVSEAIIQSVADVSNNVKWFNEHGFSRVVHTYYECTEYINRHFNLCNHQFEMSITLSNGSAFDCCCKSSKFELSSIVECELSGLLKEKEKYWLDNNLLEIFSDFNPMLSRATILGSMVIEYVKNPYLVGHGRTPQESLEDWCRKFISMLEKVKDIIKSHSSEYWKQNWIEK